MPELRSKGRSSSSTTIKLRKVVPILPTTEVEKGELMHDLRTMGCPGFAEKPWGFREERIVRELLGKLSNEFDGTIRGMPGQWHNDNWRAVYGFASGGLGMASRKDEFVKGRFRGAVNPKDGFAVDDCIDDRDRRLLQFLIPVLHPEKPTRVTITLANTIFGALTGCRRVDWSRIISDLVTQLVSRVGKSRATPVCPYIFHLYHHNELLSPAELKTWKNQVYLLQYGESDEDEEHKSGSEEPGDESDEEEEDMPPLKRHKTTPVDKRGTPPRKYTPETKRTPVVMKTGAPGASSSSSDPFEQLIDVICGIRADWEIKRQILKAIGSLVGSPEEKDLAETVAGCLADPVETRKHEAEILRLQGEAEKMKAELATVRANTEVAKEMVAETRKLAEQVKATFGEPGSAAAKAKLFDEKFLDESRPSGSRMVRILNDFSEQIEAMLATARLTADRVEDSSRKLGEAGVTLSEISFPDSFMAKLNEVGATPKSKNSEKVAPPTDTPETNRPIELDSPQPIQQKNPLSDPPTQERNRNLSDVFENMDPAPGSAQTSQLEE